MILRAMPRRARWLLLAWAMAADSHADVAAKAGPDSAAARGAAIFSKYCVLCHGADARGDGVAARSLDPRPANLRRSALSSAQKETIIRNGGGGVGRSPSMPPWREELDERQIADLLTYLSTLKSAAK